MQGDTNFDKIFDLLIVQQMIMDNLWLMSKIVEVIMDHF